METTHHIFSARGSVFPTYSLNRKQVRWEDFLEELTPVERREGLYIKRDDYFAPLGYGGVNGGKLRQLIYLVTRYAVPGGYPGMISAGSVKSPQHAFAAVVALHYGIKSYHVLGATKPETCTRHSSVAIAAAAHAEFDFIDVGYNTALQSRVRQIVTANGAERASRYYPIDYAISLDHNRCTPYEVRDFHAIGAEQVRNIPDDVETVIIPAGSCNTLASILYGLILYPRVNVKHLHLVGVGHRHRMQWMAERLSGMGVEVDDSTVTNFSGEVSYPYTYHDLLGTGYCTYNDYWPTYFKGIGLHPTYESKIARWLQDNRPDLLNDRALFWIIGSEPTLESMKHFLGAQ